jgi:hypothetical protein
MLVTHEERQWFLDNLARGLVEYMGTTEPPVPVEEILRHPPTLYDEDFGVVDMYSNLWDATFARPPSHQGSVFVRIDLPPEERRYALARESLSALITSRHGRAMGLQELLLDELRECGEFFARHLLLPARQLHACLKRGIAKEDLAKIFSVPVRIVEQRLQDTAYNWN